MRSKDARILRLIVMMEIFVLWTLAMLLLVVSIILTSATTTTLVLLILVIPSRLLVTTPLLIAMIIMFALRSTARKVSASIGMWIVMMVMLALMTVAMILKAVCTPTPIVMTTTLAPLTPASPLRDAITSLSTATMRMSVLETPAILWTDAGMRSTLPLTAMTLMLVLLSTVTVRTDVFMWLLIAMTMMLAPLMAVTLRLAALTTL
uniref:Uncharacterized protein n=1 Tax=Arcella intermedia TaxID=1963864 RepID=A0A6B2LH64_9EUKA